MTEELVIPGNKSVVNLKAREAILKFEEMIMQQEGATYGDNDLCPLDHKFCPGLYAREMIIPAGTRLTGKIHKHDHFIFLMMGEILVATEEGVIHLKAPQYFVSPAGVKRAARTLSDTVWVTVHSNIKNVTDLFELEKMNVSKNYEEFDAYAAKLEFNKLPWYKKIFVTAKKYLQ